MSIFSETTSLYTPLTQALQELQRRREDLSLVRKVDSFFSSYPTTPELAKEPRAVIAPPLASPNLEFNYFLDVHKHLPIKSILYEYRQDKFVHLNFEKHCLGEMTFLREDSQGGKEITESVRVVDFEKDQGKPMADIRTVSGENFVDFHHRLVSQYRPDADIEIVDFSDWFRGSRKFMPELPYLRYLGLFLTNGILFSNFIIDTANDKSQTSFTDHYVLPAFERLEEMFGVAPLIVPIEPIDTDTEHYWCYYSEEVRKLI